MAIYTYGLLRYARNDVLNVCNDVLNVCNNLLNVCNDVVFQNLFFKFERVQFLPKSLELFLSAVC